MPIKQQQNGEELQGRAPLRSSRARESIIGQISGAALPFAGTRRRTAAQYILEIMTCNDFDSVSNRFVLKDSKFNRANSLNEN